MYLHKIRKSTVYYAGAISRNVMSDFMTIMLKVARYIKTYFLSHNVTSLGCQCFVELFESVNLVEYHHYKLTLS